MDNNQGNQNTPPSDQTHDTATSQPTPPTTSEPVQPVSTPPSPEPSQPSSPPTPSLAPTVGEPAPSQSATQTPTPQSSNTHTTDAANSVGSLPSANNKKTVAVAAAGISVILVILGVYAMTKDSFNTQTQQQAASNAPTQAVVTTAPTLTPTPSDPVEQNLNAVDTDLKSVDSDTSQVDQSLQATPPALE
ncbi:MAG: hypothetical protein HYV40_06105 [Candidatus Levybacteria bacterium]|nr:hypothetical protein [Candidatus Levybacteria bacterium]